MNKNMKKILTLSILATFITVNAVIAAPTNKKIVAKKPVVKSSVKKPVKKTVIKSPVKKTVAKKPVIKPVIKPNIDQPKLINGDFYPNDGYYHDYFDLNKSTTVNMLTEYDVVQIPLKTSNSPGTLNSASLTDIKSHIPTNIEK